MRQPRVLQAFCNAALTSLMAHSASLALASPSRKGVLPKDLLFGTLFKLRMNIILFSWRTYLM